MSTWNEIIIDQFALCRIGLEAKRSPRVLLYIQRHKEIYFYIIFVTFGGQIHSNCIEVIGPDTMRYRYASHVW